MPRSKNYLNNDDLVEELYKSIDLGELTRKGLDMLMKLAQRTQRGLYYSCEDDQSQCLSEAYFDICKRWDKFNPYAVRKSGFELLCVGDQIKFYKDINDRTSLIKCEVLECPEICYFTQSGKEYINMTALNVDLTNCKEYHNKYGSELNSFEKRKLKLVTDVLDNFFEKRKPKGILSPDNSKVLVQYKEDGKLLSKYITKEETVVKDPNAFSYFTSICINGYAKGFKDLKPKKDKGRFISLDSGFNSDDGINLYNI